MNIVEDSSRYGVQSVVVDIPKIQQEAEDVIDDTQKGSEKVNKRLSLDQLDKLQVRISGPISQVYTSVLNKVLGKDGQYTEAELEDNLNAATESQQQLVTMTVAQGLIAEQKEEEKKAQVSVEPDDYIYTHITTSTHLLQPNEVIKAINDIIENYNREYEDNNYLLIQTEAGGRIGGGQMTLETLALNHKFKVIRSHEKFLRELANRQRVR